MSPAACPSPEAQAGTAKRGTPERTWSATLGGLRHQEYLLTPLSTVLEITDKKAAELEPTD